MACFREQAIAGAFWVGFKTDTVTTVVRHCRALCSSAAPRRAISHRLFVRSAIRFTEDQNGRGGRYALVSTASAITAKWGTQMKTASHLSSHFTMDQAADPKSIAAIYPARRRSSFRGGTFQTQDPLGLPFRSFSCDRHLARESGHFYRDGNATNPRFPGSLPAIELR